MWKFARFAVGVVGAVSCFGSGMAQASEVSQYLKCRLTEMQYKKIDGGTEERDVSQVFKVDLMNRKVEPADYQIEQGVVTIKGKLNTKIKAEFVIVPGNLEGEHKDRLILNALIITAGKIRAKSHALASPFMGTVAYENGSFDDPISYTAFTECRPSK